MPKKRTVYKIDTPKCFANIWGGEKLFGYGKRSEEKRIGESWEISFVRDNEAMVSGKRLTDLFDKDSWGKNAAKFDTFPYLTKFIDAKDNLSVQVHPSDKYAQEHENSYGKTELWYIVDADEGAGIYLGFSKNVTEKEIRRGVRDGSIEELLTFVEVKAGDFFYIPAGTVHAICGGVLIYEIQQNSTLTYRLYDYNRRDDNGRLRELHTEKALAVLDPTPYSHVNSDSDNLIGECEYFKAKKYVITKSESIGVSDASSLALTAVRGEGEIHYADGFGKDVSLRVKAGDSFLVPACEEPLTLTVSGNLTLITVGI